MQKMNSQPRRIGKTSRARAAVRVLRKAGYTWDNGSWKAPFITLTVRECDIDRIKAEWQHATAKEPCADMRLQPYQEKYMRKATGLHQIAEPGQSGGGCKP